MAGPHTHTRTGGRPGDTSSNQWQSSPFPSWPRSTRTVFSWRVGAMPASNGTAPDRSRDVCGVVRAIVTSEDLLGSGRCVSLSKELRCSVALPKRTMHGPGQRGVMDVPGVDLGKVWHLLRFRFLLSSGSRT